MNINHKKLPITKKIFQIDGLDFGFEGFTNGVTWNGWRCPMFTKEIAEKVLGKIVSNGEKVFYDENKDTFILLDEDGHDAWKGSVIEYEGQEFTVYDIGYGSWTWSFLDPVKNKTFIEINDIQIFTM